jgi:hypothetical protein
MATPSPAEVLEKRTSTGGWTRAQLEEWGVDWPPPKGWRNDLIRQYNREAVARQRANDGG